MGKQIVINADQERTRIAILENGALAELYYETEEHERTLGNIYLAQVRKVMPSIRAAFVDIGQKQDAFLHFSDLSENLTELLAFVEEENPQVGEAPAQKKGRRGQRRRPKHQPKKKGDDAEGDAEGADEKGKEGKAKTNARARGRRRSAQRRSQNDSGGGRRGHRRRGPNGEDVLRRDQRILVKVTKEPIAHKGSRVSTDISLAGRFLVLVPLADYVAVSKKIVSGKERRRLRALAKMLVPPGFGVIVRTVAEGKDARTLDTDLRLLVDRWRKLERKLKGHPKPPRLVHEDVNMVSSVVRDLFSDDYERVLVDDARVHKNVKSYIQAVAPHMADDVQLYKGNKPIFEEAGIAKDVASVFDRRVDLPSGGYLFIERTEAMHVVDVNSGRSGRGMTQEQNSLRVNLESARIIARHLRLRDIGGIIVVDFIDMRDEKNRQKVFDELRKEFKKDRAVTKLLPMSDFGLVQITRQRLRPSLTTTFDAPDAENDGGEGKGSGRSSRGGRGSDGGSSNGRGASSRGGSNSRGGGSKGDGSTGKGSDGNGSSRGRERAEAEPAGESSGGGQSRRGRGGRGGRGRGRRKPVDPDALVAEMDEWLSAYRAQGRRGVVALRVHPFTAAYLHRRVPNQPTRWFMRHLVRVRIEADVQQDPLRYRFCDARSGDDLTREIRNGAKRSGDSGDDQGEQKEAA